MLDYIRMLLREKNCPYRLIVAATSQFINDEDHDVW